MHHTQFVTDCCLHYAIKDGSVSVAGVDAYVKPEQIKGLNSRTSIAAHPLNNLFEFQPMGQTVLQCCSICVVHLCCSGAHPCYVVLIQSNLIYDPI